MRFLPLAVLALAFPVPTFASPPTLPLYLFSDSRYIAFLLVYASVTALCVLFAHSRAKARDAKKPTNLKVVSLAASFIMMVGLLYQIVHHVEHVSQIFQYWYLSLLPKFSKGLFFFLDLEWNHFIFDTGYFFIMGYATLVFADMWHKQGKKFSVFGASLLILGFLVQGWHAVEHVVRITRHITEGCDPCRGVVDAWTGWHLIPLHFGYNTVTLTLPLMAFFYFRMDRKILAEISSIWKRLRK